jgi:hypothetical protein
VQPRMVSSEHLELINQVLVGAGTGASCDPRGPVVTPKTAQSNPLHLSFKQLPKWELWSCGDRLLASPHKASKESGDATNRGFLSELPCAANVRATRGFSGRPVRHVSIHAATAFDYCSPAVHLVGVDPVRSTFTRPFGEPEPGHGHEWRSTRRLSRSAFPQARCDLDCRPPRDLHP